MVHLFHSPSIPSNFLPVVFLKLMCVAYCHKLKYAYNSNLSILTWNVQLIDRNVFVCSEPGSWDWRPFYDWLSWTLYYHNNFIDKTKMKERVSPNDIIFASVAIFQLSLEYTWFYYKCLPNIFSTMQPLCPY